MGASSLLRGGEAAAETTRVGETTIKAVGDAVVTTMTAAHASGTTTMAISADRAEESQEFRADLAVTIPVTLLSIPNAVPERGRNLRYPPV
jgi:hypothetical protein